MKQILILSIFLPSSLLTSTPKPELLPVSKESVAQGISKEVSPGVNIHLTVANSHDVDNKNSADAANIQGQKPAQVIHHFVTIKQEVITRKEEESYSTIIKKACTSVVALGIASMIPFGKLPDLAKETLSKIDTKKVMNAILRRG
jgi:hypothetical protein